MTAHSDTTLRVRYAETDQMGVVYYGNFFTWFEVGRVELCRALGFTYRRMERDENAFLVVAEAKCSYKRPARFDDLIRIRTHIREARSRTVRFAYEVFNHTTGDLLATGETLHVVCDAEGRPRSLPESYRKYFPLTSKLENTPA